MPLLVGQETDQTLEQKVDVNGFITYSSDLQGKCFKSSGQLFDYPYQQLKFGEVLQLSCSLDLNLNQLKDYCQAGSADKISDYQLFKQFDDKFNYVAMLGNPSTLYTKDWVKVIKKPLSDPSWDDQTNTCTIEVGYNVKILTSVLGFENNLQKYVVGAVIEPITEKWTFFNSDPNQAQSFSQVVFASFHEMLPQDLLNDRATESQFFLPKLPTDLFYPLNLGY